MLGYSRLRTNDAANGRRIREQLFTFGAADSTETNLYNLRVMDRKRDALVSALRAIFVPPCLTGKHLRSLPPLHSLYYAYRPLRLSKVYSTSLWRQLRRLNPGKRNV